MFKNPLFKLASRIVCLAVLTSAALWLNASVRADPGHFTCILSQNTQTGAVVLLSCGSSAGDTLWDCTGSGSCVSDPNNDSLATMSCHDYANGCPEINFY
jgi:hypothetical protein